MIAKVIDCECKYLTNGKGFNSKDSQWRGKMDCWKKKYYYGT